MRLTPVHALAWRPDEIEIENELYSMALDVIGEAVFNYEFGALNEETPIIKAVYRVLRESEHRSTFPLPYWQIPGAMEADTGEAIP